MKKIESEWERKIRIELKHETEWITILHKEWMNERKAIALWELSLSIIYTNKEYNNNNDNNSWN